MWGFGVKELDDMWSLNVLKQEFLQKQLLLAKHSRRATNTKRKKKTPQQPASGLNTTE